MLKFAECAGDRVLAEPRILGPIAGRQINTSVIPDFVAVARFSRIRRHCFPGGIRCF
jgi:hypothetical protein